MSESGKVGMANRAKRTVVPATQDARSSFRENLPTRVKLILAAEALFGEYGIEAIPLRVVAKSAGQKNTSAVQYHFRNRFDLLHAIFEYREAQLDPQRRALLAHGRAEGRLEDIRWPLRICFEPNFHLSESEGVNYIKLHAQYLSTHRPRGVLHPVDEKSRSTENFRKGIDLLHQHLPFLDLQQFMLRLESVGTMFLGAVIQNAARPPTKRIPGERFFLEILEMMAAAISAKPPSEKRIAQSDRKSRR